MPKRLRDAVTSGALLLRTLVVTERDAWVQAKPGRAFEVSLDSARSQWIITLTHDGRVVAVGSGETWEVALAEALIGAHDN
jgi:hypothetical protein